MTDALRPGLPSLPEKMRGLPLDHRQFPVPFFVAWIDGKPDHRVADPRKVAQCVQQSRCWICGQPLGVFKAFCTTALGVITRVSGEPPSHLECATYAQRACPFLTRPHAKRRDAGMPEEIVQPPGEHHRHNPGVGCIFVTRKFGMFAAKNGGVLFDMGEPSSTEWFHEGRAATADEVRDAMRAAVPILEAEAHSQGPTESRSALLDLVRRVQAAAAIVNKAVGVNAAPVQ